jgi:hypothetical protein
MRWSMDIQRCMLVAFLLGVPRVAGATDIVEAGNGFYTVLADLDRNGAYAVGTGLLHPITLQEGAQSNVLSGGFERAGVSFNSIRSYTSETDYFFGFPSFLFTSDPIFDCRLANTVDAPSVAWISDGMRDVGFTLTWQLEEAGDHLLVEQRLVARGDEPTNAAAEVTLSVTNLGTAEAQVGFRYVWAWTLGNHGVATAPTIGPKPPEPPAEPLTTVEVSFDDPTFRSYIVSLERTPSDPGPTEENAYIVEATMGGIPMDPPPTPPDRFLHTRLGEQLDPAEVDRYGAINTCFAQEIADPPRFALGGPSTAGVYYWGDQPETALVLAPGEQVSVTQYVFAYLDFPLACDAGPLQVVECDGHPTAVGLDGSGSANLGGGGVDFLWSSQDPAVVIEDETAVSPVVLLDELGVHDIDLLVHQGPFATGCSTQVELVDTTPPRVLRAMATPSTLWPPNHRLVPVRVAVETFDECDTDVDVRLIDVTVNEPDEVRHGGDGHTRGDVQGAVLGTADFEVLLRAERQGGRSGRTYTLLYEVTDEAGNVTVVPVEVPVDHDRRRARRRP